MKNMFSLVLILFFLFMATDSFAGPGHLKTEEVKEQDIEGTFTVILYGARDYNDIETVAILDYEEDQYTIKPHAPEFDYKIKKGLSAREALNEAYTFTSYHPSFWRQRISRIIDQKGNTIGYEVRPLYMPFRFGRSDVLEIYYRLKDGMVKTTIRIVPTVEQSLPERTLVSYLKSIPAGI